MQTQNKNRDVVGQTELLRQHPLRFLVIILVLAWITYCATGFRNPLTPILHLDTYEGALQRQLLFTSAALSALSLMFFTRNIGSVFTMNRPMLLLSIIVPASIIWSTDKPLTMKRTILFMFALSTLYALIYSSPKPTYRMLKLITGSVATIALISLLIHFAFGQAYTVNPMRPGLAGTSSHPNTLAPIMSIALICSLGIKADTLIGIVTLRTAQALIGIALLLAQSITTLATTILAIGLFSLLMSSSYKRGAQQLFIITVFTIGSVIGWSNIKSAAFKATNRDESLSGRDEVWKIVLVEGFKTPIFGNGYGAFWTEGKGRKLVHTWNPRQSHNAYLDLWVDLGIVGLGALLYAIPWTLYAEWNRVKGCVGSKQRRAMAALYAFLLSYLLTYALAQSYFMRFDTFPFMATVWAILVIANNDQNQVQNEFNGT